MFDVEGVCAKMNEAYSESSEVKLLEVLKNNSFLFYELYQRKYGIRPLFHEISFGTYRCDFAWLNDNSDGPEWTLVEIEKPKMKLFRKNGDPTAEFNHAIQQLVNWDSYFEQYPERKRETFGCVSRFRFVLVAGEKDEWNTKQAMLWRKHYNAKFSYEIRSMDVFHRSIEMYKSRPDDFWSFCENPISQNEMKLRDYINDDEYLKFHKLF